jgi:hypothetical protein
VINCNFSVEFKIFYLSVTPAGPEKIAEPSPSEFTQAFSLPVFELMEHDETVAAELLLTYNIVLAAFNVTDTGAPNIEPTPESLHPYNFPVIKLIEQIDTEVPVPKLLLLT